MAATVTGLVVSTRRHGHTINGNPMISVTLSTSTRGYDGITEFRISNDAMLAYGIENPEYRDIPHVFALTRAGRISHDLGTFS